MKTSAEKRAELKAKRAVLEAAGWSFERRNSDKQWVRRKSLTSRQFQRAIEHAWKEHHANAALTP